MQGNKSFEHPIKMQIGWSLWNLIQNPSFDENYYVRNPEKLGYKFWLKQTFV